MNKESNRLQEITNFCKLKGFFFQSCEIYGGVEGFFDYGPLGVEIKNNIKQFWWYSIVYDRNNIEGLDGSIFAPDRVLSYTDHVHNSSDLVQECISCKKVQRWEESKKNCEFCYSNIISKPYNFNTLYQLRSNNSEILYLRPATAQHAYVNFSNVLKSFNHNLPFGIAQIGKAFRQEVNPTSYLFRMREFEQMELQFFVDPEEAVFWQNYWLKERIKWWRKLGLSKNKLKVIDVPREELAHYSKLTYDIYYDFSESFSGEIEGIANRQDFDLASHSSDQEYINSYSKVKKNSDSKFILSVIHNKKRIFPFVIEPATGVDRAVFAVICEAYTVEQISPDKRRTVLKFKPHIAPFLVALVTNNDKENICMAKRIKKEILALFLGRVVIESREDIETNFKKHDEFGTPFCVVITKKKSLLIRNRDTLQKSLIAENDLYDLLKKTVHESRESI